ncbi:hypothetical protein MLD38_002756 [Melastoma candidum]|uniref:Uncharacterized protein n=1 Tax=Melastoma candidum TaxID=119954 RepID=A0ACB9S4U2_9MYRT|nr:hypothetical protein MLD38_002756 [Melastoma candidum]
MIQILDSNDRQSEEPVLEALATLVQGEFWEMGCNYLAQMSAIPAIVKVSESGRPQARDKGIRILEKMVRIDKYRMHYPEPAHTICTDSDSRMAL